MERSLREEMEKTSSQLLGKIANGTADKYDVARYQGYQLSLVKASYLTAEMVLEDHRRKRGQRDAAIHPPR